MLSLCYVHHAVNTSCISSLIPMSLYMIWEWSCYTCSLPNSSLVPRPSNTVSAAHDNAGVRRPGSEANPIQVSSILKQEVPCRACTYPYSIRTRNFAHAYTSQIASFPGSPAPERKYMYAGRAWYLFSRDHDVIKIGPEFLEQKGNVLCVVHPTMHSTLRVSNVVSFPLPLLFSLFWVFEYAHTQLRSFYPLSTLDAAHRRKNIRLSPTAQLQCSRSGAGEAWERGY